MEDSRPSMIILVNVAPLQIDPSVQRKHKAKRGLGVDSDAVLYRMVAEGTSCTEREAKQGMRGASPRRGPTARPSTSMTAGFGSTPTPGLRVGPCRRTCCRTLRPSSGCPSAGSSRPRW
eukprot:464518-Alexandrium_andersonii.AAC.1